MKEKCEEIKEEMRLLEGEKEEIRLCILEYKQAMKQQEEWLQLRKATYQKKKEDVNIQYKKLKEKEREFQQADRAYEEDLIKAIEVRGSIKLREKIFMKANVRIKEELAKKYEKESLEKKQAVDLLKAEVEDCRKEYENCKKKLERARIEKVELENRCRDLQERIADAEKQIACITAIQEEK